MILHLEQVPREDNLVAVKDTFQKMTLDVIARWNYFLNSYCSMPKMRIWNRVQLLQEP